MNMNHQNYTIMNKTTRKLIVVLLIFASQAANAQIKFGVKAGMNIVDMKFKKEVVKADNRTGFYVGPTVKYTLPVLGLGVDASALYDRRSVKLSAEGTGTEETFTRQTIDIPINVRYTIGLGSMANVFIYAGPQYSFNVGKKDEYYGAQKWRWKDATKSANVGVGATIIDHIQVNANYNFQFDKSAKFYGADGIKDGKTNAWQIGVAYFF